MNELLVKWCGNQPYDEVFQAMRRFTDERVETSSDELWLLEHPAVFTLGQAGKKEHILNAGDIPVVQSDRGGQVTYHGPGQLVGYLLVDIKRKKLGVRDLVTGIEQSVIGFLKDKGVEALAKREAPGVYVGEKKIAALGLRVRKGRSYHGFSLNVKMDLSVFQRINPCGYEGLEVVDLATLGISTSIPEVAALMAEKLSAEFGYDSHPDIESDRSN